MTTPSQAPLSLPLTFTASFWPSSPSYPSYRSSTSHLFTLLQSGIDESASITTLVREFIAAQRDFVRALERAANPSSHSSSSGAGAKTKELFKGSRTNIHNTYAGPGPSAAASFRTLHATSLGPLIVSHSRAIQALEKKVAEPFGEWSEQHTERVRRCWSLVEDWIDAFEEGQDELDRLRSTYEQKCRQADEAEDDARFSGIDVNEWSSAGSRPPLVTSPADPAVVRREESSNIESESDRERRNSAATETTRVETAAVTDGSEDGLDPVKLERRQTLRKQFGFSSRVASGGEPKREAALDPFPTEKSTLERSPTTKKTLSAALNSALSGPALQGIRDRLAAAAGTADGIAGKVRRLRVEADKVEGEYLRKARRLDTLRCRMEDIISDTLSTLQRLEMDRLVAVRSVLEDHIEATKGLNPSLVVDPVGPLLKAHDPSALLGRMIAAANTGFYRPQVEVFHPFYHDEDDADSIGHHTPAVGYGTGWAGFGMNLDVRARSEALYRQESLMDAVTSPSKAPMSSNEPKVTLPIVFSYLLSSLEQAYSNDALWPPPRSEESADRQSSFNSAKRKIWLYDVSFRSAHACREAIISHTISSSHPGAELGAGLQAVLDRFDPPTKVMTLKIWLAELAGSLAAAEEGGGPTGCGGGLIPEENWYLVESLYRAAESVESKWRQEKLDKGEGHGSKGAGDVGTEIRSPTSLIELDDAIKDEVRRGVLEDLTVVLGKLSLTHLTVLDSLISHLRSLIASTTTQHEPDSRYINKLALSLGSFILRPVHTTPMALLSPIPTLLLIDLITSYNELLPPALRRKQEREATSRQSRNTVLGQGLPVPVRKRTKPVDRRVRRSQLNAASAGDMTASSRGETGILSNARELLASPFGEASPGTNTALARSPPKISTDLTALRRSGGREDEEEEDTPTPIAQRLFGSLKGGVAASASALNNGLNAAATSVSLASSTSPPSTSSAEAYASSPLTSSQSVPGGLTVDSSSAGGGGGSSNGGSDYGTPTEEVMDKGLGLNDPKHEAARTAVGDEAASIGLAPALPIDSIAEATEKGADITPTASASAPSPEGATGPQSRGAAMATSPGQETKRDRPLSNVARLSRQFANSTTIGGVAASSGDGVSTAGTGVGAGGLPTRSGAVRGPRSAAAGPRGPNSGVGAAGGGGGA